MAAGVQLSLAAEDNVGLGIYLKPEYPGAEDYETIRLLAPVDAAPEFGLFIESGLPLKLLGLEDPGLLIGSANLRTTFGAGHSDCLGYS